MGRIWTPAVGAGVAAGEPEIFAGKAVTSGTADTAFLLLNAQQIEQFFRLVVDQNVMSAESPMINVQGQQQDIPNIDITDGQIVGGLGATTQMGAGDELAPTFSGVSLNPQAFEIRYPFETTRLPLWNVEGAGLERTMDELIGTYYFNQMEEIFIHSDASGADPAGWGTGSYSTIDGWIPQAVANCHVLDWGLGYINTTLFETLLAQLPIRWRGTQTQRSKLRFYVPSDVERQFRFWLQAQRATAWGDQLMVTDTGLVYSGIPIIPVPKMSTNCAGILSETYTTSGLAYILLCEASNKVIGYNPTMRVFKHPRDDGKVTYVNLWGEYDCGYINEDAVAVAANVVPTIDPAVTLTV